MFENGTAVVYGTSGVCRVVAQEQKLVRGNYVDYLVLRPVYDKNTTFYIPKNSEEVMAKLRPLLSKDEILELIRSMPDEDTVWIDDNNLRKQKYNQMIGQGDRRKLIKLIKTLYIHQNEMKAKGKSLHQSDEAILKQAEKLLNDEFALVLDIKPENVNEFIVDLMNSESSN